jgi:hypothetical protein
MARNSKRIDYNTSDILYNKINAFVKKHQISKSSLLNYLTLEFFNCESLNEYRFIEHQTVKKMQDELDRKEDITDDDDLYYMDFID